MAIKTNQLTINFNFDAIDDKYDVFKIDTTSKYFNRGAYILDAPTLCNNVASIFFDSGRTFYVLMTKFKGNQRNLKQVLLASGEGDSIIITQIHSNCVGNRILVSLLLNALGSYKTEFLRFNNLTGHLYCLHSGWVKRSTMGNESQILKIPCLEISINKDMRLDIAVRTFTSELLKKQIAFGKRSFEQYPKYVLGANNTLRRKLASGTEKCFILRQTQGDKTEIPFMDIQNFDKFQMSKMGVVSYVIKQFNDNYQGMCNLEFTIIQNFDTVDNANILIKENKVAIKNMLKNINFKIVDLINDDYSARFCKDIQNILLNKYDIKSTLGKRVSKDCVNVVVVHYELYYNGMNDPYKKEYSDVAIQHITLEDFMGNATAAISTVIHELLIKRDIINKKLSLFDWYAIGEPISFGVFTTINDEERYFFMNIKADGTFDFVEQKLDFLGMNEYTDCVNIFSDSKDVAGIIKYDNGDINVIRNTSWYTIPEIEKIYMELSNDNTYLRNKEMRDELLSSVTDIKMFEDNKCQYYFVGVIGNGMRANVSNAANIRMIEPYNNSKLRFNEVLPLMNVTYVRNNQLTVVPFPFKYLREYIASLTHTL